MLHPPGGSRREPETGLPFNLSRDWARFGETDCAEERVSCLSENVLEADLFLAQRIPLLASSSRDGDRSAPGETQASHCLVVYPIALVDREYVARSPGEAGRG